LTQNAQATSARIDEWGVHQNKKLGRKYLQAVPLIRYSYIRNSCNSIERKKIVTFFLNKRNIC
jgi:hypothetical protein